MYNTDPSYIRVPTDQINLVPTDVRGLTFARTPQQVRVSVMYALPGPCLVGHVPCPRGRIQG